MNKLFYQILGITGIVLGGITVLDWVSSQDMV